MEVILNCATLEFLGRSMSADKNFIESKVNQWVQDAFLKENFKKIDVKITGGMEKGEGYLGDIAFVKFSAVTYTDQTRNYDLVLKCGKPNEGLRKKMPVRLAYEREIFVYSKAVPSFSQFEQEKDVKLLDYILPKCFNTLLYDNEEVLVLQNLRPLGYVLHDRMLPLDINHLKLTLEKYGKWHGLSLAYRDQHPEEFDRLFGSLEDVWEHMLSSKLGLIEASENGMYDLLERNNELQLANRLRSRFTKGFRHTFLELKKMKEEHCVFLHGDCWSNNMMFKYDDLHTERPHSVHFLDFQMSNLGSPVLDLANHIYGTASENELRHFKDLLRFYHSSLSITIRELGSDPEHLFPYAELVRQWRIYSSFGIICLSLIMAFAFFSKEDVVDIQDMTEHHVSEVLSTANETRDKISFQRTVAVVRHFLEFDDFQ